MLVSSKGSVLRLLIWQWKHSLFFLVTATAVAIAHRVFGLTWLTLPALPLAVVGGALGIFVSFRTNAAYQRWWEGRKLWGRLINTSRHWSSQVMAYVLGSAKKPSEHQESLIWRHIAYVHALRCLLRLQAPADDKEFRAALRDPWDELADESNLTHALLQRQLDEVTALSEEEHFDEFRLSNFDLSVRSLLDIQGGCERIKKTPLPQIYGFMAIRLIQLYALLFPLTIVVELGWWTIPINLVVCLGFAMISEVGRVLEDPFNMFVNGLPLSAISRMIEVNLRQRMGEGRGVLPEMITVDEHGILM